jgi:hypothetical protein
VKNTEDRGERARARWSWQLACRLVTGSAGRASEIQRGAPESEFQRQHTVDSGVVTDNVNLYYRI